MDGLIILVLIVLVIFICFIVFDKRKVLMEKIKKIFTLNFKDRVKKEKSTENKEKIKSEEKKDNIDYDTEINQDNFELGKEPENFALETNATAQNSEEIDLDKLFEELEQADKQSVQKYRDEKDKFASQFKSDDGKISLDEINDFLENSFESNSAKYGKYGIDNNLTGKELGEAIKNLPPQIKAIIVSDILKPKY